jgi:hypothetical protein
LKSSAPLALGSLPVEYSSVPFTLDFLLSSTGTTMPADPPPLSTAHYFLTDNSRP